jgi:hypothetical protein
MVEDARLEVGADTELVAQALLRRLRALQPNAIERFQELWEQAQDEFPPFRRSGGYLLPVGAGVTLSVSVLACQAVSYSPGLR